MIASSRVTTRRRSEEEKKHEKKKISEKGRKRDEKQRSEINEWKIVSCGPVSVVVLFVLVPLASRPTCL